MPGRTPLARLGRVPPGVWTAAIWCAYTADSLRVYSGLPGLPREPSGLTLSASLVLAAGAPGWEVYALTAVIAWLAGDSVRRARNYAERLRAHAVAEAVTAERLRISRELHDLVAHSMGIITLQAGAAARVIDTQPQR